MSQQTDQWMHLGELPEDAEAKEKELQAQQLVHNSAKLRLMQDLEHTPGFKIFIAQLKGEAQAALSVMEHADNQIVLARATGTYTALTRACELVAEEIKQLLESIDNKET